MENTGSLSLGLNEKEYRYAILQDEAVWKNGGLNIIIQSCQRCEVFPDIFYKRLNFNIPSTNFTCGIPQETLQIKKSSLLLQFLNFFTILTSKPVKLVYVYSILIKLFSRPYIVVQVYVSYILKVDIIGFKSLVL